MSRKEEVEKLKEALSATALELRLAVAKTTDEVADALRSVAEATGTSPETLNKALSKVERDARPVSTFAKLKRQWNLVSDATKRIATSAFFGLQFALFQKWGEAIGDKSGLFSIVSIIAVAAAIYNLALGKTRQLGAISGAAFGLAATISLALFSLLFKTPSGVEAPVLIPVILGAALLGYLLAPLSDTILRLRFQHDPEAKRADLLRQLIELQEQLRQTEQVVTFLNVDVVDSTKIKASTDPLTTEYSFGEYTKFVIGCAAQFNGQLHSTAGDGVLLVFDHPTDALQAAKRIVAGLIEFNAFRNKTKHPFAVRCGIHTGSVMSASGDARDVSYSHVIDLSAHVQRSAPVNGIAITSDAALFLPGGPASAGDPAGEVHGKPVFEWRSAPTFERIPVAEQTPPPLPQ